MLKRSTIIRSGLVLLIAAATGHFMQNGDAIASKFSPGDDATPTPSLASGVPLPPMALGQPSNLPFAESRLPDRVALLALQAGPAVQAEIEQSPFEFVCQPELSAAALPGAQLSITLIAPCNAAQNVTVKHAGLTFSSATDDQGVLTFMMPALEQEALVSLTLGDGAEYELAAEVPDAAAYKRAAFQWQGAEGFAVHAFENGANFGELGHVFANAPRDPSMAKVLEGGYLTLLGDRPAPDAYHAQVYTLPIEHAAAASNVDLVVEAEVLATNCARKIHGEALQFGGAQAPISITVELSVPDCDAIGDFLVLNNLLEDMTIAVN
ncbi:MAG: hypothetical protein ACRBBK_04595 [Paracoccaceae bacterium]